LENSSQGGSLLAVTPIVINDGLGEIKLEEITPTSYRTIEPYTYNSDTGRQFHIPAGFITDGASSPFRILITTWGGHYSTAALVHDFLYTTGVIPRVEADAVLFEIMSKTGVNFWVKWSIWFIIRGFGGPGLRGLGVRQ
jgi:hypothetical protein